MSKIFLNDVNLYYEDLGEGSPLLLLHGLTSNLNDFNKDIEYFKTEFRVIALDLRGHGRSSKPHHYLLDDHINDVIELLNYLEVNKFNVIGTSMGSYIAQGVAIKIPERVDKLVLVSTKSEGSTSSTKELFKRHESELRNLNLNYEQKFEYLSQYIYYNVEAVERENKKNKINLSSREIAAANKAIEGFDFRNYLYKINAKTLIISGRYDGLNPPEYGLEISKLISKSKFIVFENSGHNPGIEERKKYLKVIDDFLMFN